MAGGGIRFTYVLQPPLQFMPIKVNMTDTSLRRDTHYQRVKTRALRECLKTLKSKGVTIEELKEYTDKVGFETLEQDRRAKLSDYRLKKATARKRVAAVRQAHKAKKELKEATNTVKTPKGKKAVLELEEV